jgi:hypothetical protein
MDQIGIRVKTNIIRKILHSQATSIFKKKQRTSTVMATTNYDSPQFAALFYLF